MQNSVGVCARNDPSVYRVALAKHVHEILEIQRLANWRKDAVLFG